MPTPMGLGGHRLRDADDPLWALSDLAVSSRDIRLVDAYFRARAADAVVDPAPVDDDERAELDAIGAFVAALTAARDA